jgi:hypothetical protein
MTAIFPVAVVPLGAVEDVLNADIDRTFFDVNETVLSQYANSPVMLAVIASFSAWLDLGNPFNRFYNLIWNIDTAVGHGLDVWGRILGVGRVLQVPSGEYIGFEQQPEAQTFGHGILFRGINLTNSASLTDDAYRILLMAKAALNITDASIPAINQILLTLFGDGYVRDNLDMTMTYVFSAPLDPVQTSIVFNSGVLPRPCGVSATVETP